MALSSQPARVPHYFSYIASGFHTPASLASYIVNGAQHGFSCHFHSRLPRGVHYTPNYGSSRRDATAVSTALLTRLREGKTLGPLPWDGSLPPPLHTLCVNPLGSIRYKLEPDRARPIDDPFVNDVLYAPYFPMPAFALVRTFSTPGCWYATQDVRGAFPCLPLHPSMWPFFALAWFDLNFPHSAQPSPSPPSASSRPPHSRFLYIHTHGLFGPRDIPYIWTMYMLFVTLASVHLGIALTCPYLDDVTHIHDYRSEVEWAMERYSTLLDSFGTPDKLLKRVGPFQRGEILGREFNSRTFTVAVPMDKMRRIRLQFRRLARCRSPLAHALRSTMGLAAFVATVLPPIFGVFLAPLLDALHSVPSRACWGLRVRLSRHARSAAATLAIILPLINRRVPIQPDLVLPLAPCTYTDASGGRMAGWGYATSTTFQAARFTCALRRCHINLLELAVVLYACRALATVWAGCRVPLRIDNTVVIGWLHRSRARSELANAMLHEIFALSLTHSFHLRPTYITSADNVMADALSRSDFARFYSAYLSHTW